MIDYTVLLSATKYIVKIFQIFILVYIQHLIIELSIIINSYVIRIDIIVIIYIALPVQNGICMLYHYLNITRIV